MPLTFVSLHMSAFTGTYVCPPGAPGAQTHIHIHKPLTFVSLPNECEVHPALPVLHSGVTPVQYGSHSVLQLAKCDLRPLALTRTATAAALVLTHAAPAGVGGGETRGEGRLATAWEAH